MRGGNSSNRRKIHIILVLFFLQIIPLFFYFNPLSDFIFNICEKYFSPDQSIASGKAFSDFFLFLLLGVFNCGLVSMLYGKEILSLFSQANRVSIIKFWPVSIFALLVLHFLYRYLPHLSEKWTGILFEEDGISEWLSFILPFISAGLLIAYTIELSVKSNLPPGRFLRFYWLAVAFAMLLLAGEEINWGQRLFGWETPDWMLAINYQDEFNIHNMFIPYYKYIYPGSGYGLLIVYFSGIIFFTKRPDSRYKPIFPSLILAPLVVAIFFSSLNGHSELMETLLALFVSLYALQQVRLIRSMFQ